MQPNSDEINQVLNQLNRLDSKFDDLRRELMASFVLKQVFDAVLEGKTREIEELREALQEQEDRELGKFQRGVAILGGLAGAISAIILIFQHFHF